MLVHCYNCERVEKTINGACSHCGLLSGVVAAVSCADTMGCLKCIGALKELALTNAAPEMLEALKAALVDHPNSKWVSYKMIEAAIAKAEGK